MKTHDKPCAVAASPAGSPPAPGRGEAQFPTTLWSTVLAAGGRADAAQAAAALARLCERYWYPLYAFVRRQGHGVHDAEDLTQAFFTHFLETQAITRARPERGKFRSFLLASLKNFLADHWDKARAKKRGGGQKPIELDAPQAEQRYALEPVDRLDPEKIFQRRWAMTVLERVLARLEAVFADAGKKARFEVLQEFLTGDRPDLTYAEAGRRLGLSEGSVANEVSRMRARYRELFKEEIADTVEAGEDVAAELRHILAVLSQ